MIRKLRIKFVLTAVISVFVVLVVMLTSINLINYMSTVVSDSDRTLQMMVSNGGKLPDQKFPDDPPGPRHGRINSAELSVESHCFSVTYDTSDNIVSTDNSRAPYVSSETAEECAEEAVSSGKIRGFVGRYRYLVVGTPDGGRMVLFCDCASKLFSFRIFREASIIISLVCLLIVSIIIFFVSGKVIKPIAESYEKQKRFITDAGHEIKTPLAIINADSDVLISELGEDNEWLTDIKKQTGRLTDLTNELVYLSKMEEGSSTLKFEKISLSELAADQADSFSVLASSVNKELVSDIDKDVFINGDRKAVYELFSILLDNAIKYSPEGKTITLRCSGNDKASVIEVTNDTSDDIRSEDLANLFDRFYRTDASRNSETGGYGIGLSIAKAIVEAHRGKITAVKDKPNSIKFIVSFKA